MNFGINVVWIRVDFLQPISVTGITTQGGIANDEWVKTLQIHYGNSAETLGPIMGSDGSPSPMASITWCN